MKNYRVLEHTADIGIMVEGKDLKSLFKNAGMALFQISSEKIKSSKEPLHKMVVNLRSDNVEDLFVNWLNELLSLSAVEGMIFEDYQIDAIDDTHIEAVAFGGEIQNYKVNTEIKAATYHQLSVKNTGKGWCAEVIFDV